MRAWAARRSRHRSGRDASLFLPLEALAATQLAQRGRFLETPAATAMLVGAVWAIITLGAGWSLVTSRAAAMRAASDAAGNLAASVAEYNAERLDHIDSLLVDLIERVETDGLGSPAVDRLNRFMARRAAGQSNLRLVGVSDDQGRVVASSAPERTGHLSVSGKPGFIYFKDNRTEQRVLSPPFRSDIDGTWLLSLTRRWNRPDGSFGGEVVGAIDLAKIEASFRGLNLGAAGIVSLWSTDGVLLSRLPPSPALVGQVTSGWLVSYAKAAAAGRAVQQIRSSIDNISRLYAFQRVPGYDLLLFVGLATDHVLADWRTEAQKTATLAAAMLVAVGLFGLRLFREADRRTAERAAYRLLVENATDMIFCLDRHLVRRYVSPAAQEVLGHRADELVGTVPLNMVHADDVAPLHAAYAAVLAGAETRSVTNRIRHRDGRWIWVEARLRRVQSHHGGEVLGIIGALRDVSARKAAEAALENANRDLQALANTDGLTGLANRRRVMAALQHEVGIHSREEMPLAVIMIDVDCFKMFNDCYGHPAGDSTLRAVAETIRNSVRRRQDVAARYGGEEFMALLPATPLAAAGLIAEKIESAVRRRAIPHAKGVGGIVTVSIGVAACIPAADAAGETLIKRADEALYAAKAAGRARVQVADDAVVPQSLDGAPNDRN